MVTVTEPFTAKDIRDMLDAIDKAGESWPVSELAQRINDLCETLRVLNDEVAANRERIRVLEKKLESQCEGCGDPVE